MRGKILVSLMEEDDHQNCWPCAFEEVHMRSNQVKRYLKIVVVVFISLFATSYARATTLFTTPQAPLPPFSGNGLVGSIWTDVPFPVNSSDRNLSFVNDYIANIDPTPDANFLATTVDYPGSPNTTINDSLTVADFLGPDSTTLTRPIGGEQLFHYDAQGIPRGFILEFNGFFSSAGVFGDRYFVLQSDDHSELLMKGAAPGSTASPGPDGFSKIAANERTGPLNVPYPGTPWTTHVNFVTDGLYQVKIHYFDAESSQAGIKLFSGSNVFDPFGNVNCAYQGTDCTLVPQSSLYTTPLPEPRSMSLVCLGLVGLVVIRNFGKNHRKLR